MSLLTPLALLGLSALAIPVLIHLIQRERRTVTAFPSLMFLRRVPVHSVRRRRIHNWALLALRLIALAVIVAAFARPFLRQASAVAIASGARDVVILLDRSYSMEFGDVWKRAQAAASNTLRQLGPDDRASLVLFSGSAEVVSRSSTDRGSLLAAVEAARPDAGATGYGAAFKLAGSLLAQSPQPRREVVLISDFQRAGWQAGEAVRLPPGTRFTPVPIPATGGSNLAATPVAIERESFSGRERVTISGGFINRSAAAVANVPVALEVDGRAVQTMSASADAGAVATVTFAPLTLTGEQMRGAVQLPADALARDNSFFFSLAPAAAVPVALITAAGSARDDAFYVTRALEAGSGPRFAVARHARDALATALGTSPRAVVVHDVDLAAPHVEALERFVRAGGGLLLVLGSRSTWPSAGTDWLPGRLGSVVDRTRGAAATMGRLEYGHVVFEPFRAPRAGDFSTARFYTHRGFTSAGAARVLARFDDGAPALVEGAVGAGRVLVWTAALDAASSDLPLQPVFLPFLHRLVSYAAAHREVPASVTVGSIVELSRGNEPTSPPTIVAPGGERTVADAAEGTAALPVSQPGFYEIRDRPGDLAAVRVVASNVALAESDLAPLSPDEVASAVAVGGAEGAATRADPLSNETLERSQRIWWFLLFTGILLLTAESWLSQRLSRAAP